MFYPHLGKKIGFKSVSSYKFYLLDTYIFLIWYEKDISYDFQSSKTTKYVYFLAKKHGLFFLFTNKISLSIRFELSFGKLILRNRVKVCYSFICICTYKPIQSYYLNSLITRLNENYMFQYMIERKTRNPC